MVLGLLAANMGMKDLSILLIHNVIQEVRVLRKVCVCIRLGFLSTCWRSSEFYNVGFIFFNLRNIAGRGEETKTKKFEL